MYKLEEPIYFYLFTIIPVIIVIFLLVLWWKKKTQKKFAELSLLEKLAPNQSVFKSVLKLSFLLLGLSFLIIALALAFVVTPQRDIFIKKQLQKPYSPGANDKFKLQFELFRKQLFI